MKRRLVLRSYTCASLTMWEILFDKLVKKLEETKFSIVDVYHEVKKFKLGMIEWKLYWF